MSLNDDELKSFSDELARGQGNHFELRDASENLTKETSPPLSPGTEITTSDGDTCDGGKPKDAELTVYKIAIRAGVEAFSDQHGEPMVWTPVVEPVHHFECLGLHSKTFLRRLLSLVRSHSPREFELPELMECVKKLELDAIQKTIAVQTRTAAIDGRILIDIGSECWSAIEIDSDGWRVTQPETPVFTRSSHQRNLPEPEQGGCVDLLFTFLHLEKPDEQLLVLVWLLSAFVSSIASPILLFTGNQGSAKTTRSRRLRSLVDPSQVDTIGEFDAANLFHTFQTHAVPIFENVSQFTRKAADVFCRAVTGNAVERRKQFTDRERVLFTFRRAIIINGISSPSSRPDFMDRCITIQCERLTLFEPLSKLDEAFNLERPKLLGALLDLLSRTLKCLPDIESPNPFRMADFALFGRAVASAWGMKDADFDRAYQQKISIQDSEAMEGCAVANLIRSLVKTHPAACPWEGTASELLRTLQRISNGDLKSVHEKLPKSPRWLSTRLGEIGPLLSGEGIVIEKRPRTNSQRGWVLFQQTGSGNIDASIVAAILEKGETNE